MKKTLLVGDTHPEMLAIAKALSAKSAQFRLILPFYISEREFKLLSYFVPSKSVLLEFLRRRVLDSEIEIKNVFRPFASLDVALWLLKRLNQNSWAISVLKCYKKFLSMYLNLLLRVRKFETVIAYDTISIKPRLNSNLVVICPMTHPKVLEESMLAAREDFPTWPSGYEKETHSVPETLERASHIVTLSAYSSVSFIQSGFSADQIIEIPIGPVHANSTSLINPPEEKSNKLRILFLGQINLRKGVPAVLTAAEELSSSFEFQLVGQCLPEVAHFIRSKGLKNLVLVDNPGPDEIHQAYIANDVFILPSYNEGFGIAVLEAMSYGLLPVVSTSVGASNLLMGSSFESFLIKPGSIEGIVRVLESIYKRDLLDLSGLRTEANEISKRYSFSRFANELIAKLEAKKII